MPRRKKKISVVAVTEEQSAGVSTPADVTPDATETVEQVAPEETEDTEIEVEESDPDITDEVTDTATPEPEIVTPDATERHPYIVLSASIWYGKTKHTAGETIHLTTSEAKKLNEFIQPIL